MALRNLNIVVDSKFDPLSFEDMAKPYMMYKQEFDKQQEALGELDAKASIWEGMADKEKDPIAYAKYKAYSDNLRQAANSLATNGLSSGSKAILMALKGDYSSRITPIENAYNRRQQLADEQRKMIAQNPTMLYQRMASNMSLDDFVTNPQADYGQQYNGAMLTQQVANIAESLAKEVRDSKDGRGVLHRLGLEGQYEYIKNHGYSSDAVMDAIRRSPNASSILTNIVDNAISSSGVLNWGDENTIRRAYDYANQGLYKAVGTPTSQMLKDEAYFSRLSAALQDANDAKSQDRKDYYDKEKYKREHPQTTIDPASTVDQMTSFIQGRGIGEEERAMLNELAKPGDKAYSSYMGKSKDGKSIFGAMMMREKFDNLVKYYIKKNVTGGAASGTELDKADKGAPTSTRIEDAKEKALERLRKDYGVKDVLSDEQYKALKAIGYNDKLSKQGNVFNGHAISQLLDETVQAWSPTSISVQDYNAGGGNDIRDNLVALKDDKGRLPGVVKLNNDGTFDYSTAVTDTSMYGKTSDGKFDVNGNTVDIGYFGIQIPEHIIVKTSSGTYAVHKGSLKGRAALVVAQADEYMRNAKSIEEKVQIQKYFTNVLREALDGQNPVASNTSSELTWMK